MLLLLLACSAHGPDDTSQPASTDTGADAATDSADSADSGDWGDTGDSGVDTAAAAPTLTILAPADGQTWFLDTRYDVVVSLTGADAAEATVTGAEATCEALNAGVLHCSVTPHVAETVTVSIAATGPGGTGTASVAATARAAVGIIPEGEAFAMGAYEVMDERWFAPIVDGKFNLAQSYGTGGYTQEAWQDWAAAAGVRTMTRPGWDWADPWALSDDATLAALAARPELAWWELPETPVEDDSYADEVATVVARIRSFDDRPTQMYFWTSSTAEQIATYIPDVQVISPGTYPEHACQPQPWIRWRITSARDAVALAGYSEAERPVVGTADLYAQPETSCPERIAELAQVRMNPLAMIAAGAQGVLYFAWWYAANTLDPAWATSAEATGDLIMGESGLGYAAIHGEPLGDLPVTVTGGPALSETFTPAQTTTAVQYASIHAAGWDYAGTRFVVAVNYTNEAVTAEIGGFPSVTTGVEAVGEARAPAATDGVIEETFDAWGAHVYRAPIVVE